MRAIASDDARILVELFRATSPRRHPRRPHFLSPILERNPRFALQCIFFLLGIGNLIPWNAFTNAKEYFETRTCHSIESALVFIYTFCMVFCMGSILVGQWILFFKKESNIQRENSSSISVMFIWAPFSATAIVMGLQSLSVWIMDFPAVGPVAWASLAVCGAANALMSAGCVACAGGFPSDVAMNPHLTGQAVAGVTVSVVHYITASFQSPEPFLKFTCEGKTTDQKPACAGYTRIDWSVFGFFFLGFLLLAACMVGLSCIDILRSELERQCYESEAINATAKGVELPESPRQSPFSSVSSSHRTRSPSPTSRLLHDEAYELYDSSLALVPGSIKDPYEPNNSHSHEDVLEVFRMIRKPAACIYITFLVSITMFPVWTSALISHQQCSTTKRWANDLYTPLTFVLFNVGDLAGRIMAANPVIYHWAAKRLFSLSLWRVLFVPLLFSCKTRNTYPWFQLQSDMFSVFIQFSFGCSHGLLLTTSFVCSPLLLLSSKDKNATMVKLMSEILMFALAFGLLSGSVGSFPITWLARPH